MDELIKVTYDNDRPVVSARELHEFLEVKTAYKDWFPRMCEYGFTEGVDFNPLKNEQVQIEGERTVTRHILDAALTIDMAKEICMIQRSEKGKQARQYFIQLEKDWNSPEKVMARALEYAHKELATIRFENKKLTEENTVMKPKAEYFDDLVERNTLTNIRNTAKEFKIKQRNFIDWLLSNKYLYRDQKGRLMPYAQYVIGDNKYFELKDSKSNTTKWSGQQLFITPAGKEAFRMLVKGLK